MPRRPGRAAQSTRPARRRGSTGRSTPIMVRMSPFWAICAAGATTWLNWTQYADHGPDDSVLGDLRGRRVLELGSGSGCNLAHLATLGACCVGVDLAPSRAVVAQQTWGHLPNLDFVTGDVVD